MGEEKRQFYPLPAAIGIDRVNLGWLFDLSWALAVRLFTPYQQAVIGWHGIVLQKR